MICKQDIERLERLYEGCRAYHGELHDHSDSGGTSDGKCPLREWPAKLRALHMDFAAILDHKQIRHMYQPVWEDGLFIPGTEPGTHITDSPAEDKAMHYNILLPCRDQLETLLNRFPEYQFSGGTEGHFKYPDFTRERFCELIDAVKAMGGLFVHPHPRQLMRSNDPTDYWFRDGTGIEVFYISMDSEETRANYTLWLDLLAAGKRVWACAGCDLHSDPRDTALTTVYAESRSARSYLSHLSAGDFTCGPVGVRMAVGSTRTGGSCSFRGQKLTVCVGDFHESVSDPAHEYRADILNENGVVLSGPVSAGSDNWFSLDTADCAFYRAEVFDATRNLLIAVGNPIWNLPNEQAAFFSTLPDA
ncbi:MAG: hypothetical protein II879_12120 [Clostridia bacterium]|nr:hypothetical protein [Clostridia bacterium]MBQ4452154.1 hypothetical protein [Clostridia bacterium]